MAQNPFRFDSDYLKQDTDFWYKAHKAIEGNYTVYRSYIELYALVGDKGVPINECEIMPDRFVFLSCSAITGEDDKPINYRTSIPITREQLVEFAQSVLEELESGQG